MLIPLSKVAESPTQPNNRLLCYQLFQARPLGNNSLVHNQSKHVLTNVLTEIYVFIINKIIQILYVHNWRVVKCCYCWIDASCKNTTPLHELIDMAMTVWSHGHGMLIHTKMAASVRSMGHDVFRFGQSSYFVNGHCSFVVNSKRYERALKRTPVKVIYPDGKDETLTKTNQTHGHQKGTLHSRKSNKDEIETGTKTTFHGEPVTQSNDMQYKNK